MNYLASWVSRCSASRSALILCVVAMLSLLSVSQLQIQHGSSGFFKAKSGALATHNRYTERYPAEQRDILYRTQFQPDQAQWLNTFAQFHQALEKLEGVDHVISLLSSATKNSEGYQLVESSLSNRLISGDKKSTLVVINMKDDLRTQPVLIEQLLEQIEHISQQHQLSAQIAGLPVYRVELRKLVQNDVWLFFVIGILVALLLIWRSLQQFTTAVLILMVPALAVLTTLGLMALSGIGLSILTQMLVVLIVVIGASDSLHLAHRLLKMRKEGVEQSVALKRSVLEVVPACMLTSLTTAIGFASLLVSQSSSVQQFGYIGFLGSVMVVTVVVLSLPMLAESCYRSPMPQSKQSASNDTFQNRCIEFVRGVMEMRVLVLAVFGAIVFGMVMVSKNNKAGYEVGENIPTNSAYNQAVNTLQEDFDGGYSLVVMLEPPKGYKKLPRHGVLLNQVDHLQKALNASFEKPWTSIRDLIKAAPGNGLNSKLRRLPNHLEKRFWDPNVTGSAILIYNLSSHDKHDIAQAVNRTRAVLNHSIEKGDWQYSINGFVVLANDASKLILTDLLNSLLLAMALIVALCVYLFRKVNWALMVLLPTAFPILAVTFALTMMGEPIRYMYALLFSVCFGLSVDSAIHILIAYKNSLGSINSPVKAMGNAFAVTGMPLLLATVVVAVGFAVLILSSSPTLSIVGGLGALATTCALVSALVLIPTFLEK